MQKAQYRAIAEALRGRIDAGIYPVGTKLPSISALMQEFEVKGLNTVRAAQRELTREGLLRPEQGVGVWVVAKGEAGDGQTGIMRELRKAQVAIARAIAHLEGERND